MNKVEKGKRLLVKALKNGQVWVDKAVKKRKKQEAKNLKDSTLVF